MGPDQPLKICLFYVSNKGLVENIAYDFAIFKRKKPIFENPNEQHTTKRFFITVLLAYISGSDIRYIDEERNLIMATTSVLKTNVVLISSDFQSVVRLSFKHFIVPTAKYDSLA